MGRWCCKEKRTLPDVELLHDEPRGSLGDAFGGRRRTVCFRDQVEMLPGPPVPAVPQFDRFPSVNTTGTSSSFKSCSSQPTVQMRALQGLRERVEDLTSFEVYGSSKGAIVVEKQQVRGGMPGQERPLLMWRINRTLHAQNAREVFSVLIDTPERALWDKYVAYAKSHGKVNGMDLVETCFDALGPVAKRIALEFRICHIEPGENGITDNEVFWIAFTSTGTEHTDVSISKSYVQTYTNLSGYRIRPGRQEGTVEFTMVTHIDAGGNLPDWIIRKAGPKGALDFTNSLQNVLTSRVRTSSR